MTRIDPVTNRVLATIPVGEFPTGLTFAGDDVWVTHGAGPGSVSRINRATNKVTATVPVGNSPSSIAFDGTNVWVANTIDSTVSKIDPTTNTVTATIPVERAPAGMAFDGTDVWVASLAGTVSELPHQPRPRSRARHANTNALVVTTMSSRPQKMKLAWVCDPLTWNRSRNAISNTPTAIPGVA